MHNLLVTILTKSPPDLSLILNRIQKIYPKRGKYTPRGFANTFTERARRQERVGAEYYFNSAAQPLTVAAKESQFLRLLL